MILDKERSHKTLTVNAGAVASAERAACHKALLVLIVINDASLVVRNNNSAEKVPVSFTLNISAKTSSLPQREILKQNKCINMLYYFLLLFPSLHRRKKGRKKTEGPITSRNTQRRFTKCKEVDHLHLKLNIDVQVTAVNIIEFVCFHLPTGKHLVVTRRLQHETPDRLKTLSQLLS